MFSFLKDHKPFANRSAHIEKMSVAIELRLVILIFFISSFVLAVGFFSANGIRRVWQTADVVVSQQLPKTEHAGHAFRAVMSQYLTVSGIAEDFKSNPNLVIDQSHVDVFDKDFRLALMELKERSAQKEMEVVNKVEQDYMLFNDSVSQVVSSINSTDQKEKNLLVSSAVREVERNASKVISDLSLLDSSFHESLDGSIAELSSTEESVRQNVFIVSLLSLLAAFVTGAMIIRKVILMPLVATENETGMMKRINTQLNKSNERLIRRELELAGSNSQLQEMGQKKNDFISLVAHQLRTPLTGIKWTIDMLLQGGLGSLNYDQRSFLKKIGDGNERMIRFVNDLLSVDRIESGRFQYNFTPVDIRKAVEFVVNEVQVSANLKSVHVLLEPDDASKPHPMVSADEDKIKMLLQNIIENGVRYSSQNSSVYVTLERQDKDICISVKDNGIGIEDDEKDKIFSRFYRAPNAIRKDSNGTGLGLYLAKNIADGHRGSITFSSSKGEGTIFKIRLPTLNS